MVEKVKLHACVGEGQIFCEQPDYASPGLSEDKQKRLSSLLSPSQYIKMNATVQLLIQIIIAVLNHLILHILLLVLRASLTNFVRAVEEDFRRQRQAERQQYLQRLQITHTAHLNGTR